LPEELLAFLCQHNVTRLARLTLADSERASVSIKVGHLETCKLAIAAPCFEASMHNLTEVRFAGIK